MLKQKYDELLSNFAFKFNLRRCNQAIGATTPFFTAILSLFIMRQKETYEAGPYTRPLFRST